MKKHDKIPKQTDNPHMDAITFLKKKQFELANIGITHKMSFDWRAAGVYLQEKKTKYRMKYSGIEYIWLLLVKELRGFGLPIKSVLHLKDFLLMPINVEKLLLAIQDEVDMQEEVVQLLGESTGVYKGSKNELKQDLSEVGQNIVDSMFCSMLISTLLREEDYFFLIKKDGSCLIESQNTVERSTLETLDSFANCSCLRIPLKMLLAEFLEKEGIKEYDLSEKDESGSITQTFDFKSKEGYGKFKIKDGDKTNVNRGAKKK